MKKYLIMIFVAAAAVFQSCNNNDDLWDAIDDLKSRVQALETQVDALNGNIEAIQTLANNGTISSVKEENGKCIIEMTNGKKLTLVNDISAQMPTVKIVDGVWHCTVNGKSTSLEVKAVAEDGVTPQFRVNEETGNWQVKTTGDWVNVTYDDGVTPVKAIADNPQNDTFFESVKVNGDYLEIVMKGGDSTLRIPIVKDFLCQIVDSEGAVIEGIQTFPAGVEKNYTVNMRGVVSTIVSAPEGWTAVLSDPSEGENGLQTATLTVTSPAVSGAAGASAASVGTRATASTAKDVSILASSGQFSCIAKIQVESTGQAPVPPTAQVAFTEATTESLTFTVTLSEDTESWKYICRASTEEAPSVEDFETLGTVGTDLIVTIPELAGKTAYKLYVVAYANGLNSTVAEAEGTTKDPDADPNDYYTNGVEIEGVTYNQSNGKLVEADQNETGLALGSGGVYFLDGGESNYSFNTTNTSDFNYLTNSTVVIGRNATQKSKLNLRTMIHFRNKEGVYVFKNLEIDATTKIQNYTCVFSISTAGVGGAKTLLFEDCDITFGNALALFGTYQAACSDGYIENIIFRNCKLRYVNTGNSGYALINISHLTTGLSGFKTLVFENNVIYAPETTTKSPVSLFYQKTAADMETNSLSNLDIVFNKNTIANVIGYGTSSPGQAYFLLDKFKSVSITNNLIYNTYSDYFSFMSVMYDYSDMWPSYTFSENYAQTAQTIKGFSSEGKVPEDIRIYNAKDGDVFTSVDLNTGTLVPADQYAGYGSDLR